MPLVRGLSWGLALCALLTAPVAATQWRMLESLHAVIQYQSPGELAALDEKIYLSAPLLKSIQLSGKAGNAVEDRLAAKIDFIFERVQTILDMRVNMPKATISIYKDYIQITMEYRKSFKRSGNVPRSWYVFEYRTVYVNLEDISTRILAHEIAHHVVDNYFQARPDAASGEILAVFAEKNFETAP